MTGHMGLTDLTAFVSFGESLEPEPCNDVETSSTKSPKISRQQSRAGGLGYRVPSATNEGKRINDLQMTEKEQEELYHTKTFRKIQSDIKERQKRQRLKAEKENLENLKKKELKLMDGERQLEFEQQYYVDKDKQIVCAQGRWHQIYIVQYNLVTFKMYSYQLSALIFNIFLLVFERCR